MAKERISHRASLIIISFLKKIKLYDFSRNYYHKKLAYSNLSPKWDLKNKLVHIKFEGIGLDFKLTDENKKYYNRPIWKCEPLIFLTNELKGYILRAPFKNVENGVCLDIGSYQGALPVYLKRIRKSDDKIICFEPVEENYKILEENLSLNNIRDVELIKKGVWNKKGNVSFECEGETSSISDKGKEVIPVTDIDSELKRLKIPYEKVGFIKMDIEGAELEALDGMKNLLTKGNPRLSIASYHWRNGEQTCKEVEKKLRKLGYKTKTGYPNHLTTWAWRE